MSKEQVSGSLTLSLGGLADEVAGEVVTRLASTLRELARPQLQTFEHNALIGVLTGFGVPFELAEAVARGLAKHGLAVIQLPQEVPPAAGGTQPESAVDWFEREVNGQ